MKTQRHKLTTRFAAETRFEVTPQPSAPFRAFLETELEKLERRLLQDLLNRTADAELNLLFRHAAHEAVALAVDTGFPLLVLPFLFEEKTEAARRYALRQAGILKETSNMVGVAA